MAKVLEWFPCYALAFLEGCDGLSSDARNVYFTLILMMYAKDGPVPDLPSYLANRTALSTPKFKAALDELITLGKVIRDDAGGLFNARVRMELSKRVSRTDSFRERQAKSVEARRQKPPKSANGQFAQQLPGNGSSIAQQPLSNGSAITEQRITDKERKKEPPDPPFAKQIRSRDFLDEIEATLRQDLGPCASPNLSNVSPIVELLDLGYSFEIIRAYVRRQGPYLRRLGHPWAAVRKALRDNGPPPTSTATATLKPEIVVPPEHWPSILEYSRQYLTWSLRHGPCPGQEGCLAPPELLQEGDGVGWHDSTGKSYYPPGYKPRGPVRDPDEAP